MIRPAAVLALLAAAAACAADPAPPEGASPMAPRHENRLAKETSPYLLQHARNPVDWYPWGEEAFAKARREGRPVFLSIGYSTCHWCHVMERESFEDAEIAAYLDAHFVAIKVDREERPDVDAIYMTAIQASGQGGGWPLSAFLDHDRRPFFLGTYFPPADRHGRPGFLTVLRKIREAWTERRADVDRAGGEFAEAVRHAFGTPAPALLTEETLSKGVRQFASRFDDARGGFGEAPKFPRGHSLSFLLEAAERPGLADAREMALATLRAMSRGGMYDQAGGGFHRYSTDGVWLVPHFEKMLYDQALLVPAYVDAFLLTGEEEFARTARETLEYCLRDLRHADGGFFCAEDADSEGVEGKFYLWTEGEIRAVLGEEAGAAMEAFGARSSGNFHGEAEEAPEGANILHRPGPGIVPDAWKAALLSARSKRVRPHLDDKVLAAWNGLGISAFARAGRALGEPRYLEAAGRAADFVLARMRRPDGRLLRTWRDGKGGGPGFLDDHAFMAAALLDLYEATGDPRRLEQSLDLARTMLALFSEEGEGALYDAGKDAPDLLARTREGDDWAVPSGNSGAALLLLRLGRLTGDGALEARGREILRAFSGSLDGMPLGAPAMLRALDFDLGPTTEVVIAGDPSSEGYRAMEREISRKFRPRLSLALRPSGPDGDRIAKTLPWLAGFGSADGSPSAALCRGGTCTAPVATAEALRNLLDP